MTLRKMLGVASAAIWLGAGALCADVKGTLKDYRELGSGFAGNKSDFIKVSHERRLTTRFQLKPSPNLDSVNINISIEPQQLTSIVSRGGWVEVRLYVGPRGSERRLERRTYELRRPNEGFTLPYQDVCQEPGTVSVKVETTVKGTVRSYTDSEAREDFVCGSGRDNRRPNLGDSLKARIQFKSIRQDGLVRFHVNVDPAVFSRVKNRGGYVEVRIASEAGEKAYRLPSPEAEYTFPPSLVCNANSLWPYQRDLKVWVSTRDSWGGKLPGFRLKEGARYRVPCTGTVWGILELIEEILED